MSMPDRNDGRCRSGVVCAAGGVVGPVDDGNTGGGVPDGAPVAGAGAAPGGGDDGACCAASAAAPTKTMTATNEGRDTSSSRLPACWRAAHRNPLLAGGHFGLFR